MSSYYFLPGRAGGFPSNWLTSDSENLMCETETLKRINEVVRGLPQAAALEVLSLAEHLSRQQADATQPKDNLLAFMGLLKDSPNFNGDLVAWQREQRSEWR